MGEGNIVWYIIIIGIIWSIFSLLKNNETGQIIQEHPNYESYRETRDCSYLEPDNPYSYGSGHYAGFEWVENKGYGHCSGNSSSFIEGCKEYLRQEEVYNLCVSN